MTDKEKVSRALKKFSDSQIFVNLAKNGDLQGLINHVYLQDDPYVNYKSPSGLAKNALAYFIIYNHVEAFENFFSSRFAEDLIKDDIVITFERINMNNNIKMFEIFKKHYMSQLNNQEKFNVLIQACTHNATDIIKDIIEQYNKENKVLSQEEKMQCCLAALNNDKKDEKMKHKNIMTFKLLEHLFPDLKYHQQDDILMYTLEKEKNTEMIHYLMYDKKLRITKHLNILAWGNPEFSQIVEKRKVYDSMLQKMKNKEKLSLNLPTKTKKLKI